MSILVSHMTPEQIGTLKDEFEKVDTDMSGFLELVELEEALAHAKNANGDEISQEDIHKMVVEIDLTKNSKINYSEFLAATVDPKKFLTDEKCMAIFKTFDVNNTGEITDVNL